MLTYLRSYAALRSDTRAVTAMEYGLIAALVAVVIITSITLVGTNLSSLFNTIAGQLAPKGG